MGLPSLPANCWYVVRHITRSFGHGIRHPFTHPRHVLRHIHRVRHAAPPKSWVSIVCKAAHVAGAGAAIIAPPAAIVAGAPYAAPYMAPPGIEQFLPGGGGSFGGGSGGFPGGGFPGGGVGGGWGGAAPIAYPAPQQLAQVIPPPEAVILQPYPQTPSEILGPPSLDYTPPGVTPITTTQAPHSVPEPNAVLLFMAGVLGAIVLSVSKKAAQ